MKKLSLFICFIVVLTFFSCSRGGQNYVYPVCDSPDSEAETECEDEDILQDGYPASVSLYRFTDYFDSENKCVGWYAIVDLNGDGCPVFSTMHVVPAKTPEGVFKELSVAGRNPYIVTNAGYFYDGSSMSLCIHDGELEAIAAQYAYLADGGIVYPVRAAFGMFNDGSFDTAWVYCPDDGARMPYSYPSPLDNDESTGSFMPDMPSSNADGAVLWMPEEAIGGGPMLVEEGRNVADVYYYREILDRGGTAGMTRQPRTAIAATNDGRVIILVCDGRGMNGSQGYTLAELADKLVSLGAEMAVNLDGGGSSAIVGKDGKVLNRPSDTGESNSVKMRQVPTVLVISEQ